MMARLTKSQVFLNLIQQLKIRTPAPAVIPFRLNKPQHMIWSKIAPKLDAGERVWVIILKARREGCCLTPSTRILTADLQWVPISKIQTGDTVVACDEFPSGGQGAARKLHPATVLATRSITSLAVRLTMSNGEILIATPEHRFLCKRRGGVDTVWRHVSDMKIGDTIRWITRPWAPPDYEDGWFGGLLDGEGSLRARECGGSEIKVTQLPGPVLDRAKDYLSRRGYSHYEGVRYRNPGADGRTLHNDGYRRRPIGDLTLTRINEIFQLLGQTRPSRFLARGASWWDGKEMPGKKSGEGWAIIEKMELLNTPQPMIDLQTTTGTFIAEGFVSHNSTLSEALMFIWTATQPLVRSLVIAHDFDAAKKVWEMSQRFLTDGPYRHIGKMQEHSIRFGDSILEVDTAASPHSRRGSDTTCCHFSELAFWKHEEALLATIQTLPKPPIQSLCIIESTANGMVDDGEQFYNEWQRAVAGESGFTPIFLSWIDFPDYRIPGALVEDLDDDEQELTKVFHVTQDQLAWRRYAISDLCQGSLDRFSQEYPACISADTRISTEKGIVRIVDASTCKETESGSIVSWGQQPVASLYRMITQYGRILDGTADHPIRLESGEWCELSLLHHGQRIRLLPPRFSSAMETLQWNTLPGVTSVVMVDEWWARCLGYFQGDGSYYGGMIEFVCDIKDQDVIRDVCDTLQQTLGIPIIKAPKHPAQQYVVIRLSSVTAGEVLHRFGVVARDKKGNWKRHVCVPESIFRSPKHIIREFLSALFESDGSGSGAYIRWYSKYEEFARDVQLLLLGFGIPSKIKHIRKQNRRHDGWYEGSELRIVGKAVDKFYDEIGFRGVRKQATKPIRSGRGRKLETIQMTDTVQSVSYLREDISYDVTVDDSHIFSANGIETHNTAEDAFVQSGLPFFASRELMWIRPHLAKGRKYRVDVDGKLTEDPQGYLEIWKPPDPRYRYVVGADSSMGIEEVGSKSRSRSAGEVICMETMEQVAEYDAVSAPHIMSRHLAGIGRLYNRALLCPEVTASGGGGGRELIVYLTKDLSYYDLHIWRHADHIRRSQGQMYGWECVDPDAKALTADLQWVAAKYLRVGDGIMGYTNQKDGNPHIRHQTITEYIPFCAPKYEVTLFNGQRTRVSATHPFLVKRMGVGEWTWVVAADLRLGDTVAYLYSDNLTLFSHGPLTFESFIATSVVSSAPIGEGEVIGLTTDPDHTLIADGIVGHNTNAKTRPRMIARIREVINEQSAIIHSEKLLKQLSAFGESDSGKLEALAGHDDLLFAWGIALMSRSENYFTPVNQLVTPSMPDFRDLGIRMQEGYDANTLASRHLGKVFGPQPKQEKHWLEY